MGHVFSKNLCAILSVVLANEVIIFASTYPPKLNHCSSLEVQLAVAYIHEWFIYKWMAVTWLRWYQGNGPSNDRQAYMYDDVIKWKHFPRYWPFVRGIHRSQVNSRHKGQWRGALLFSLICAWVNCWVYNRETGDLRRHRAHFDVIVMNMAFWWMIICGSIGI